ncbi:MAG: DUF2752 domain-containing protein [Polyangiaceae bacterium]
MELQTQALVGSGPELDKPTLSRMALRGALVALVGATGCALVAARVPLCPFALITRLPCPGCGLTRATLAILGGHFSEGFAVQPFAVVTTPVVFAMAVMMATNYVTFGRHGMPRIATKLSTPILVALFAAMTMFWVARFFGFYGGPVPV